MENVVLSCNIDEIIIVTSAEFGRMRVGRCITENEFIGCSNDVIYELNKRCSGKRDCGFPVLDLESENRECLKSMMKYLSVGYTCIKGVCIIIYIYDHTLNYYVNDCIFYMYV